MKKKQIAGLVVAAALFVGVSAAQRIYQYDLQKYASEQCKRCNRSWRFM